MVAAVLAFVMHNTVSKRGYTDVTDQAVSDAGLIVDLTAAFVRSYSVYTAHLNGDTVPSPQLFRTKALEHVENGTHNFGMVSTGIVGIPGREIRQTAKDESTRNLLHVLEASNSNEFIAAVIDKNNQAFHRSLWAFHATEQVCTDCHNRLQNLSGNDQWQIGDLMGAQIVDQNIDTALSNVSRAAIAQTVLLFIAVVAAWLCCLYVINQLRLNRIFKKMATTDPLTGCINRRELYDRVDKMKGRTDGAVLMLDLDKFKLINDTFGHEAGDEVIKDFSSGLRDALREDDWVARFGGEEFVVWLPNVGPFDAIKMAERFLAAAEHAQVVVDGKKINYTVSIGLHIVQDATPSLFNTWMKTADELLYRAKEAGRNQIVCDVSPGS